MTGDRGIALPDNFTLSRRTSTGPDVYVEIPGVTAFVEGATAAEQIDRTGFNSPGNRRVWKGGLIDSSEGSLVINYTPGETHVEAIRAKTGQIEKWRTQDIMENGDTLQAIFDVLIVGVSRPRNIGQGRQATVTFKISGDVTETTVEAE